MSRDAMQEHDQRINGVLRKAFEGHGWTPVDDHTPLDAMMDAEPEFDEQADAPEGSYAWPSEERSDLELSALKREEAAQVAAHAREQMARWIAGGGFHPFRIVQRFYAICYARYGALLGPLNGTDLADILGQGRAAFSATMKALFGKPVVALKVPGQKSANSYAAYAANAAKHKPRQQLDGVDVDSAEEQALESQSKAEAQKRLQEQRAAAAQRELERDAAAHLAMTHQARISKEDITLRDPSKSKKPRPRRHHTR